jgi:pimeloyl-ACP methyl ester carboxylesterase
MNTAPIRHQSVPINGIAMHVASLGAGPPLILLHGWPEFWLTWEPVMRRLADRFTLIAPDLRGFGESATPNAEPSDQAGAATHAADILALMDTLGIAEAGMVAHDVGAYVVQALGRSDPARFGRFFLFDCPYPGIGRRAAEPGHLKEIWYQSFHQQPFAASIVGATRESCAAYIGHFLRHWAGRPDAFDDVMPLFIDNFLRPGVLQGGFNWYISANAQRIASMRGATPPRSAIHVPTCVRWGDRSPLMPYAWTDRLGETFADLDLAPIPCGHFPHREDPDLAAAEIARFFKG